jgi:hypothetical protein
MSTNGTGCGVLLYLLLQQWWDECLLDALRVDCFGECVHDHLMEECCEKNV